MQAHEKGVDYTERPIVVAATKESDFDNPPPNTIVVRTSDTK
jgi:hypothetical protein